MKMRCQNGGTHVGLAILAFAVFASALAGCAGPGPAPGVVAAKVASADATQPNEPGLAPSLTGEGQIAELVEGNTKFAFNLYHALFSNEANLFYSPYSLATALAMAYAGARGETEQQMAQALYFTLPQAQLHPACNALDQALTSTRTGGGEEAFRLHMANSLWGQQGYSFQDSFLDALAENYGTGLQTVDFGRPEEARQLINQWTSEQTEDRIRDFLPPGSLSAESALVLANTIYFDAAWMHPFVGAMTHDGAFTRRDGEQVTVPMMDQTADLGYAEGMDVQAIELPYAGGELAMVILLPELRAFDEFAQGLDPAELDSILGDIEPAVMRLTMPKFNVDASLEMKDALMELGMVDAFGDADFSGMDGTHELFINEVYHGARISVDEAGTEATGSTAVVMQRKGEPMAEREITINRPFLLLIRDLDTGAILFLGHVVNPTA
jgi:serpin B